MRFAQPLGTKGKILAGVILGALACLLILALYLGNILEFYELRTYDQLCCLNLSAFRPPQNIVVVAVDQGSLDAAQREGIHWPWPRQMYAPIVQFCSRAGAKAVVFDILFTEPSSYGREDDEILAQALRESRRVILPVFLSLENRIQTEGEKRIVMESAVPLADESNRGGLPYSSVVTPIETLAENSCALGNVAISPDDDGIYRRVPIVCSYRNLWLPSLGFAAYRQDQGEDSERFILKKDGLSGQSGAIPLGNDGTFLLTYYGSHPDFPRYSAYSVIQSFLALEENKRPAYSPEDFRDKIVFVGYTAAGLFDLKSTPVSSIYPGMTVHATLVANLLQKDFRLRISKPLLCALVAFVSVVTALTVVLIGSLWLLSGIMLAYIGGLAMLVILTFRQNVWVDGVAISLSLGLSFALSSAFSYATEGRQKRQIKQAFSHYMSDILIQDLLKNPDKLRLGGEKKVLSVFFSDLAGFTSLSEKLAPETVVNLLNRYLTAMTDIILESGGIIDKYEGDAIMAFWGAPIPQEDHAVRACLAALENQKRIEILRKEFVETGLPPVYSRIGINTGEMIIGNMGSSQRFDFTVIGDNVNLASRLEGAGKEYGTRIIISEETYRQAEDHIEVRELDLLRVKGKERPVRIYELLARKGELDEKGKRVRDLFEKGLALYRRRAFQEAAQCFEALLSFEPEDGPARAFLTRCEELRQVSPPPGWDGVYRMMTK